MDVLDLFSAAAGGWSLGMHRAGFRTVAACEAVDWRRALYAQNNPGVPIYDDVRTLTADRILADLGYLPGVVVGSPPCKNSATPSGRSWSVLGISEPIMSDLGHGSLAATSAKLPTPLKRDKRMDAWSPAYDRRKSPTMDAVMSGAMMSLTPTAKGNLTAPSMLKWTGARALAAMLQNHGLTGTAALPITYNWMMGYPPWVAGSRIAVGGPRGTSAASLIVEAFGDAVVPQIPEAIGRAILRTDVALTAVYGRAAA